MTEHEYVIGCPISKLRLEEFVELTEQFISKKKPHYVVMVNAAKLVKMRWDEELKQSVFSADAIGADGVPVVWASRLLGAPLPGRVNGTDLMYKMLERADKNGYRVFFFGAEEEVLQGVLSRIRTEYPGVQIAGWQHGYFSPEEEPEIVNTIRESKADILFLGFGTPKKEKWVKSYLDSMEVSVCHGVGGSFDVFAGAVRRAPMWMQKGGLEWLYRLIQEPQRLWKRYLTTNTAFICLVVREFVTNRLGFSSQKRRKDFNQEESVTNVKR